MKRRRSVLWGVVAALIVCAASLVAVTPADADCVFTKTTVQVHKTGTVRGTFKGTFEPGDIVFEPGEEIVIQIGVAEQALPWDAFKGKAKRRKYTYKGNWDQVVKKAVFDLKKGKVLVQCRSTSVEDYAPPMHTAIAGATRFVFEIPVDPATKKTKLKGPIVGAVGGASLGATSMGSGGGALVVPGVTVTAGPGAFLDDISIDIQTGVLPAGLPPGVLAAGPVFLIDLNGGDGSLDQPLTLEFSYDATRLGPDDVVTVLHFNDVTGMYEPLTVTDIGPGTITVQCRSYSFFVPAILLGSVVPDTYSIAGFDAGTNGWSIPNFGSYFSPGGNCLGMAAYCAWFFDGKPAETLSTKYTGEPAQIVATRAHLAQSQYWALQQFDFSQALGEALTAKLIRAYLSIFGDPAIFVMLAPTAGHATVVYGYDTTGFSFYDVNVVGQEQTVTYSTGGGFGTYGAFDRFAIVTLPTLGRYGDFEDLYQDAENGFNSGDVTITAPLDDETLTTRSTTITGVVANPAWDGVSVFVKGLRYDTQVVGGNFAITVPIANGPNPITVLAGTGISTQSAYAPGSGVAHIEVTGNAPASDLLVTLRWLQNGTDVDLYVYEPDGEVSWYSNPATSDGGTLDYDDTDGYGPEHYTIGTLESGLYAVRVHYYSHHGLEIPATGFVDILLNEGLPTEQFTSLPFFLGEANSSNDATGASGPDWVDIATIDVMNGVITPP